MTFSLDGCDLAGCNPLAVGILLSRALGTSTPPAVEPATPGRMQATASTWDSSQVAAKR